MRRASYAERDRMRSIDPGALDFVIDEEELEEMDKLPLENNQVGGKSMQRALNILQKQSEIPGAGTCFSLMPLSTRLTRSQECGEVWRDMDRAFQPVHILRAI